MKKYKDIEDAIDYFLFEGNQKLGLKIPRPVVDYSLRGTCAGQACKNYKTGKIRIRINLDIYDQDPGDYCLNTVGHEMAHIFQYHLDPHERDTAHGRTWQHVMRIFNLKPEVTHNYAVTKVRNFKTEKAHCGCLAPHDVTPAMYRKILCGSRYRCRICKEVLAVSEF